MRAALSLFTALPLPWDDDDAEPAWAAAALVGLLLGLVWFLFQQTVVRFVGPLVAGGVVVAVSAAMTGARPFRGLMDVASRVTTADSGPASPPAEGVATLVVTLAAVVQVALLQRINLAPAAVVTVPLAARVAQAVLVGESDEIGVRGPGLAGRIGALVTGGLLLFVPIGVAALERPVRLNPPLDGLDYPLIGVGALVAALLSGLLTRTWLRARFGVMDASGWHAVGLVAETAALTVIAVRIG